MIDTTSFESDVVITKIDESGNIQQIDLIDDNGNQVGVCKYRAKKQKKETVKDINEL